MLARAIDRASGSAGALRVSAGSGDVTAVGLLARARPIGVGDPVPSGIIGAGLRELAAIGDPVADAYAGWLLAVAAAAEGVPIEAAADVPSPQPTAWVLAPSGRAWLAAVANDLLRGRVPAPDRGTR